MNEMNQTNTMEENKTNMNPLMIVGAVVVLAIIGFFVIRSTAQQPEETSTTAAGGTMLAEDAQNLDSSVTGEELAADNVPTSDTAMTSEASMEDGTMTMDGDVKVVSMEGGSFYYKPNVIRVKKGETVRVEMESVDMMHDFVIDELDVKSEIVRTGDTATVEFVADTVGEFEFYCSVGQHRVNGMVGTLIVEE